MRQKILVVEDEKSIADTIVYALSTEGFDALHVSTGAEAVALLSKESVALVVLDVGLPDTDGFSIAREIRKNGDTPIIFLTARAGEVDKIVGLELGADDYVAKPFSPRELTARIKAVLRRSSTEKLKGRPSASKAFTIDEQRFEISFQDNTLELSPHEYRLLKVLIESPGRVYTREHLMALCWEEPEMSLERTIDAHIKNIRAKMKALSDKEVIITHRGLGYSLSEEL